MTTEDLEDYRSLYEITGDIKDYNTMLINRKSLLELLTDSDRLEQFLDDAGIS